MLQVPLWRSASQCMSSVSVRFRKFSWYIRKKTKNILQAKKKETFILLLTKKKTTVNKSKKKYIIICQLLANFLIYLYLSLSLFPTINQYLLLSVSSLTPLSLSLSLFALALHTICVTYVHISFRFSSQNT